MQPIDWKAIEAQRGPLSWEQRRPIIEMQVLADESLRLLAQAQVVEQTHAANLADPGLGPALARTEALVEQAEYIEMEQADRQRDIVEAHRRGLTVEQYQDRVEAAIAYAESPEYAQAVWERQGEQYANDRQDTEHDPADADPFGYEAEARAADEALAERMRTDIDHRRQVLGAARGKDPADMNREEYAAWSADADDRYAEGYGDRQAADYVDRMTDRDLAGELDPPRDTAAVQAERDHQDATLEYAVGDDLVIGGVVYDRDQWQPDGEGGVEPRLSGEQELARQARQAEIEESNDRNREAELAYDAEAAVDYSGPGGDHDLASDERFESQWPETKNFEDLTPADLTYLAEKYPAEWARDADDATSPADATSAEQAPSVAAELRDARTYLEHRAERDTAPREPAERDTAAQQEQAHRESARVLAERQQTEPQRGIER
jgi:hypothetical protein